MPLKKFKPTSPGRRNSSGHTFEEITKKRPEKSLLAPQKKRAGRNNQGRLTVRHRGGGHKRRYRIIDWKRRDRVGIEGRVRAIEYDPNRSARIALIFYADGEKRYILAPLGLAVGARIHTGPEAPVRTGNTMPLNLIPNGTAVHGVELNPGRGAQIVRSAGASAQIMAKEGDYVLLRLPSGEMRRVRQECYATIGQVGNVEHGNIKLGKAGPHPASRPAPPGARLGHEPRRPPPRRRRRQGAHRPALAQDALGQAHAGLSHAGQEALRQVHRPSPRRKRR